MNKAELIGEVAQATGVEEKDVNTVVATMLRLISEVVADGERVTLTGFGTFSQRRRAPRRYPNPAGGEPVQAPEKWTVHFAPGAKLRELVQDGGEAEARQSKAGAR